MRNGNKSLSERIFSSPIAFFVFLILLVFIGKSAWSMHLSAEISRHKLNESNRALDRLREERAQVESRIKTLSTPEGVESELRAKYRAVRSGESVAVIIDDTQTTNEQSTSTESIGWGEKLLKVFWK